MRSGLLAPLAAVALLVASQFAAAANCQIYEASVPTRIVQGSTAIANKALAHTVVVRDAGFKSHPIEFLIAPPAIVKERFTLAPDAASATPSSGASAPANAQASSVPMITITPSPPGVNDHYPEVGHITIMSNSAFYGDAQSNTDSTNLAQTVAAAADLGTFGQAQSSGIPFNLDPAAGLNILDVPAQSGAATGVGQVAVQGVVNLVFLDEGRALLAGMNFTATDPSSNPAVQFQYTGILDGRLMKTVSC